MDGKEGNTVNKGDFIELKYSGYANGKLFDSNVEGNMQELDPKAKVNKTIICVGQRMVVVGLDNAFVGKEIGKDYEINVSVEEGFGERKRELVKTIPLNAFTEKKVDPKPGMILTLDNYMVRVIAVSGARVVTDFNNPLAGKELHYKFKVVGKVENEKAKVDALFEVLLKFIPEFSIHEKKIVVKGVKGLEMFVNQIGDKFKDLLGKDLVFEEKKDDLEKKLDEKKEVEKNTS